MCSRSFAAILIRLTVTVFLTKGSKIALEDTGGELKFNNRLVFDQAVDLV